MKKMLLFIALGLTATVKAQFIDFPDANLKKALVSSRCVNTFGVNAPFVDADTNNDGEIDLAEAEAVTELHLESQQISSLSGLEHFTNLESLDCGNNLLTSFSSQGLSNLYSLYCYNNQLTSLDLQGLPKLVYLYCSYNQISELNIQGLNSLYTLWCSDNQLTELDLTGLTELDDLNCSYNQLSSLQLNGLGKLNKLNCSYNLLTSLPLQGLEKLQFLSCSNNQLSELDLQGLPILANLSCDNNQLTSIDAQAQPKLATLVCNNNLLQRINVKNGSKESLVSFWGNPDLACICCDKLDYLQLQRATQDGGPSSINLSFDCDNSNCPSSAPDNELYLFPNPASYTVNYYSTKPIEKVELVDVNGRIRPQPFDDVYNQTSLFVGNLESGIYIVRYYIDGKAHVTTLTVQAKF